VSASSAGAPATLALASTRAWWADSSRIRLTAPEDPSRFINLEDPDDTALEAAITARAAWLGGIDHRLAASSFVFAYTQALIAPAIATLVTAGVVPDLTAQNALLAFRRPSLGTLWLRAPRATSIDPSALNRARTATVSSRDALIRTLVIQAVEHHLVVLVERISTSYRFSSRVLRANVAYECCWAFRPFLDDPRFSDRAIEDAHTFHALAPQLAETGDVVADHRPDGSVALRFERRNCCLARLLPGKTTCEGCSINRKRQRRGLPL
jgi:ferric iron reductase protein FhuF